MTWGELNNNFSFVGRSASWKITMRSGFQISRTLPELLTILDPKQSTATIPLTGMGQTWRSLSHPGSSPKGASETPIPSTARVLADNCAGTRFKNPKLTSAAIKVADQEQYHSTAGHSLTAGGGQARCSTVSLHRKRQHVKRCWSRICKKSPLLTLELHFRSQWSWFVQSSEVQCGWERFGIGSQFHEISVQSSSQDVASNQLTNMISKFHHLTKDQGETEPTSIQHLPLSSMHLPSCLAADQWSCFGFQCVTRHTWAADRGITRSSQILDMMGGHVGMMGEINDQLAVLFR